MDIENKHLLEELESSNENIKKVDASVVRAFAIPERAPELTTADFRNKVTQLGSLEDYYVYKFFEASKGRTEPLLKYVSRRQLSRPYRQDEYTWAFPENLANVIFPSEKANRTYQLVYEDAAGVYNTDFLEVKYDFKANTITLNRKVNKLYLSYWYYIGKSLGDFIANESIPFNDAEWLIKNHQTGRYGRFTMATGNKNIAFVLPDGTEYIPPQEGEDTVVTSRTLNSVVNHIGDFDCGEYWNKENA